MGMQGWCVEVCEWAAHASVKIYTIVYISLNDDFLWTLTDEQVETDTITYEN
jgi:hypothetical protein